MNELIKESEQEPWLEQESIKAVPSLPEAASEKKEKFINLADESEKFFNEYAFALKELEDAYNKPEDKTRLTNALNRVVMIYSKNPLVIAESFLKDEDLDWSKIPADLYEQKQKTWLKKEIPQVKEEIFQQYKDDPQRLFQQLSENLKSRIFNLTAIAGKGGREAILRPGTSSDKEFEFGNLIIEQIKKHADAFPDLEIEKDPETGEEIIMDKKEKEYEQELEQKRQEITKQEKTDSQKALLKQVDNARKEYVENPSEFQKIKYQNTWRRYINSLENKGEKVLRMQEERTILKGQKNIKQEDISEILRPKPKKEKYTQVAEKLSKEKSKKKKKWWQKVFK